MRSCDGVSMTFSQSSAATAKHVNCGGTQLPLPGNKVGMMTQFVSSGLRVFW
jgi:hypothetical protein